MSRIVLPIITFFLLMLVWRCKPTSKKESFTIDFSVNDIVRKDKNCQEIFKKTYWIDSVQLNTEPYVESLLNRFIGYNRRDSYERLFMIILDQEGEIWTRHKFDVQIKNSSASIVKYEYKDDKFTPITKKMESFNEQKFEDFLNTNSLIERQRNYNILTFDFKSNNSCECRFLGRTEFDINDLKNLNLFDQFAD
ncbi:hypothetical protein [Aquimarina latercula]|uniref:hypothetical protein n=1 Tax=Aquimarina latercula TaxID=987 RepID=UPI0003F4D3EA|nr:hypothetical protein [Aquimarina latercula]